VFHCVHSDTLYIKNRRNKSEKKKTATVKNLWVKKNIKKTKKNAIEKQNKKKMQEKKQKQNWKKKRNKKTLKKKEKNCQKKKFSYSEFPTRFSILLN
jgi:hypothetical protein